MPTRTRRSPTGKRNTSGVRRGGSPAWMNSPFRRLGLRGEPFDGVEASRQAEIVGEMLKGLKPRGRNPTKRLRLIIRMRMDGAGYQRIARRLRTTSNATESAMSYYRPRLREFVRAELRGETLPVEEPFKLLGLRARRFVGVPLDTQNAVVGRMIRRLRSEPLDNNGRLPSVIKRRALGMSYEEMAESPGINVNRPGYLVSYHRPWMEKFVRAELDGDPRPNPSDTPFRRLGLRGRTFDRVSARDQRAILRRMIRRLESEPLDKKGRLPRYIKMRGLQRMTYVDIGKRTKRRTKTRTRGGIYAAPSAISYYRPWMEKFARAEIRRMAT